MVLLCHACHTTMSSRHHDIEPFRFRASPLSFVVAHVLHFVSHNPPTSPSIIFYAPTPIVKCSHNNHGFFFGAFVVDWLHQYNCYRCFYNTLSRCVHCLIQRPCIACNLLVETTCRRSYFYLASLDAWITSGRLFFNPFPKMPSTQFCSNVVCLHVDVSFLPSSLLPSLIWSNFSTSCISQNDSSSPFFIK